MENRIPIDMNIIQNEKAEEIIDFNMYNKYNLYNVYCILNFEKSVEILVFSFSDRLYWISLNADMYIDWSEEFKLNYDLYNEEFKQYTELPIPDTYKEGINWFLNSYGIDNIFNKIQEYYLLYGADDPDPANNFLEADKAHCKEQIKNIITGV